ncbi:hypothetical protein FPQ18DRAFT_314150 [Pyronema domesticum]|uniref:Stress-response A/B barrel domain-containing protein n=1 Tax=Pyronema omphalodes (strain CBS 100304) TaxID=1076935 RepID=U4L953_PYROM|nr:hypothetical protein FPQ18DRAFT_314150 [Pyronema domesticum]CCX13583.1 Similar to hypothetical protein THITE_2124052 [Thielavia terrestris NRRL 8126]; acc. no. XP_003657876 [Pyronema omphalodes CBS 100304]
MPCTHVVLCKFPHLSSETFQTVLAGFNNLLHTSRKPDGSPYIISGKAGHENSPSSSAWTTDHGYTHGFIVEFSSKEDRDYYLLEDPLHAEFAVEFVRLVPEAGEGKGNVLVFDFEGV